MKRTAIAALLAFGALSLGADEKTTTQAPAPATSADSPLVAAAKASGRTTPSKKKKKMVITNETLAKSGGHITTTTKAAQQPLPPPPRVDPALDKLAADQKKQYDAEKAAAAKAQKEAEERKKLNAQRANAIYEGDDPEGIYEDPSTAEGRADKQSPAPPQQPPTIQVQKPPQW
jgi:hypothetical protein